MLSVKEKGLLISIIRHCDKIELKISYLSRQTFDENEDIREILCFNIFQIGELAKKFDVDFLTKYSGVPWKQIKGMRDRIGHGYDVVDLDDVWKTVTKDIQPLNKYCKKILEEN